MSNIKLLYIDLFCGAGGTSTGVANARLHGKKCAKVVACVNHDANAIKSHQANHPDTLHFTEDIRTLELSPLVKHLDKMPPYIISTSQGEFGIVICEEDSPMTRKIKEFMGLYGIIDIKMRMLNIRELKRIQGFPEDYVLIGSQAEQKKFLGNAVEVNQSRVLCEALAEKLSNYKKMVV